jgi:hypothetical protein
MTQGVEHQAGRRGRGCGRVMVEGIELERAVSRPWAFGSALPKGCRTAYGSGQSRPVSLLGATWAGPQAAVGQDSGTIAR